MAAALISANATSVGAEIVSWTYSTGRDVDEREGRGGPEGHPLDERHEAPESPAQRLE